MVQPLDILVVKSGEGYALSFMLLIRHDVLTQDGNTALMIATRWGRMATIRLVLKELVKAGADLNLQNQVTAQLKCAAFLHVGKIQCHENS